MGDIDNPPLGAAGDVPADRPFTDSESTTSTSAKAPEPSLPYLERLTRVPEGERRDSMFRYASQWADSDVPLARAETLAIDMAKAADPPFDNGEAVSLVHDAYDRREGPDDPPRGPVVRVTSLADVRHERVRWFWRGYIPLGKLTDLGGDPGLGKSTVAYDLAARMSRGLAMPDSSSSDVDGPATVVILTAEDGLEDTVRPRLQAAGADLDKIVAIEEIHDADGGRLPEVPVDTARIEDVVASKRARLVVIDPLMAYMGGEVNTHRDQDVRRALSGLKGLAERTDAAVVVVRHLNKTSGGNPLYRGGGSIGIIAAVRAGLLVAPDPDDDSRRILASTKSNLGPPPPALAYRLVSVDDVAKVDWLGRTEHTARTLLDAPAGDDERDARGEGAAFLEELLAVGPLAAKEVYREAREAGIAKATLRRAKAQAGVTVSREGFGEGGRWIWKLS